ncbi:MAG: hypothetical protein IKO25_02300 [Clostridia bacterium]|nr:hypothetical protein [Clostridia bacterium]
MNKYVLKGGMQIDLHKKPMTTIAVAVIGRSASGLPSRKLQGHQNDTHPMSF